MSNFYPGGHHSYPADTIFFITFTVIDWVDVFTRNDYRQIITDSLDFCRKEKGLLLHAWVLMTNHIHMIASHEIDSDHLWQTIGDFKKFTSKKIIEAIINNPVESRKKWMLKHFREDNIIKNADASCSVSKSTKSVNVLNHTAYDCANCQVYPTDCCICLSEMNTYAPDDRNAAHTTHYHLWQRGYDKYCIHNIKHLRQKIDYLHANPVRAGIVFKPWEYRYSSYPNYCGEKGIIDIDLIDLGQNDPTKPGKW